MIKYDLCSNQPAYFFAMEGKFQEAKEYLEKVFKLIEEKKLEERLYKVQPEQRIFLYSFMLDEKEEVCIFFRRTGVNTGHFTQRIEAANGTYFHSDSLEFTYK